MKTVLDRRPAEYPSRSKAQRARAGRRSKSQDDPGGAGYEIAKEVIACAVCAQAHQATEAAAEAESMQL